VSRQSATGVRASVHRFALRTFGGLPKPARRFIVRLITPSWTSGAVVIIEREDGRWLLVRAVYGNAWSVPVRAVYRKAWSVPGGLIDRGEGPEQAVHRELFEELGIEVELVGEPRVIYDSELRRLDAVFRGRLADGIDPDTIEICTPELIDLGWFDPDDPPQLEEEAGDVMLLRKRVLEGGDRILLR